MELFMLQFVWGLLQFWAKITGLYATESILTVSVALAADFAAVVASAAAWCAQQFILPNDT